MASSGDAKPRPILNKATGQQTQKNGKLGWRLRLRDPKNVGKQPERTFYGSYEEAIRALDAMSENLKKGEALPLTRGKATITEAAELWLEAYKWKGPPKLKHSTLPDRPYSTWSKAKIQVKTYILPNIGASRRLSALTEADVEAVAAKLIEENYKPASVLTTISVMRSMFRDLYTLKIVPKNYSASLKGDWSQNLAKELVIPSAKEIDLLANELEKEWPGHGAVILFLAFTGLRFEELAALRWEDIDKNDKVIKVRRSSTESGGKRNNSNTLKTKASRRDIILLDQALKALNALELTANRLRREVPLHAEKDWSRVVNGDRGGYISYSQWRKHLKRARTASQVNVTAHNLRHIFASRLLAAGIPVEAVSEQLGHASVRITEQVYKHYIAQNRRAESASYSKKLQKLVDKE